MAPIVPVILAAARLYKYGRKPTKKAMAYIMKKKKAMKDEKKQNLDGRRATADELRIQARMKYGPKMKPKNPSDRNSKKQLEYLRDDGPLDGVVTRGTDDMTRYGSSFTNRKYGNLIKKARKAAKYGRTGPKPEPKKYSLLREFRLMDY